MNTAAERLSAALGHHQAGRRKQAQALYRSILREDPNHADTLHLLGVLAAESGNFDLAVEAICRAIQVRPGVPAYYNNLGLAFSCREEWERAAITYRQALELQPPSAALYSRLGEALGNQGRYEEAAAAYRRSAELDPDRADVRFALGQALQLLDRFEEAEVHYRASAALDGPAETWYQLGNVLHHLERYEDSLDPYCRAIEAEPGRAEAYYNLAGSLGKLNRHREAVDPLRAALLIRPDYVEAHNNLGTVFQALDRLEEAEACYREGLRRRPDYLDARYNLGFVLQLQDRLEEAVAVYDDVLAREPRHVEARTNRANTFLLNSQPGEAGRGYQEVLAQAPDHVEARWNRALLWLQTGDWERGWKEYEWRFRQKDYTSREYPGPRWEGEPLEGKTILVHAEQGLGDTIQFVRFLEPLKGLGPRVVFECQPRLKPLLEAGVEGLDMLIARDEPRPAYEFHLELMSLPYRLGVTLETLPATVPYLRAGNQSNGGDGNLRVGLVWCGNPDNKTNRRRSLRLTDLASLAEVPGVALYSLQRGAAAAELSDARFPIVNLEDDAGPISATAAAMAGLDLVISVDTMTAHLAGAMARPVWLLLPFSADWRWMCGRDASPWYPTMRLFRQRNRGDWSEVVRRVQESLSAPLRAARLDSIRPGK